MIHRKFNQLGTRMTKNLIQTKKILFGIIFFISHFLFVTTSYATDSTTQEQAIALVKKAVIYFKAHGAEQSFSAFNDTKGDFVKNELYIFVINQQGKMLAHGMLPKIIGKDVLEMKDADGKFLFKEMLSATSAKSNAWVNYKWPKPNTNSIGDKSTYLERVGDYVIGCGFYKNEP